MKPIQMGKIVEGVTAELVKIKELEERIEMLEKKIKESR